MHPVESAQAVGNWRDWRALHELPTVDFMNRLLKHRDKHACVKAVTVLKFHSADRANSYALRSADEQVLHWNLVQRDADFLMREVLQVVECQMVGTQPPKLPQSKAPEVAPPGWQIEQWRRMRGLEAMLPDVRDNSLKTGES
jgi:hypothetical protein